MILLKYVIININVEILKWKVKNGYSDKRFIVIRIRMIIFKISCIIMWILKLLIFVIIWCWDLVVKIIFKVKVNKVKEIILSKIWSIVLKKF